MCLVTALFPSSSDYALVKTTSMDDPATSPPSSPLVMGLQNQQLRSLFLDEPSPSDPSPTSKKLQQDDAGSRRPLPTLPATTEPQKKKQQSSHTFQQGSSSSGSVGAVTNGSAPSSSSSQQQHSYHQQQRHQHGQPQQPYVPPPPPSSPPPPPGVPMLRPLPRIPPVAGWVSLRFSFLALD